MQVLKRESRTDVEKRGSVARSPLPEYRVLGGKVEGHFGTPAPLEGAKAVAFEIGTQNYLINTLILFFRREHYIGFRLCHGLDHSQRRGSEPLSLEVAFGPGVGASVAANSCT